MYVPATCPNLQHPTLQPPTMLYKYIYMLVAIRYTQAYSLRKEQKKKIYAVEVHNALAHILYILVYIQLVCGFLLILGYRVV